MVLEKLIRSAKIAATNRGLYAVPLVAGIFIAAPLADGKVDRDDALILASAAAVLAIGALGIKKELFEYKVISKYCERYGFDKGIMLNQVDRRKAKFYAAESGRTNEFEQALKDYRISSF